MQIKKKLISRNLSLKFTSGLFRLVLNMLFFSLGLFNDVFSFEAVERRMVGKDLEGNCLGLIEVLSRNLPIGIEENP
jgi:hypothetical protein